MTNFIHSREERQKIKAGKEKKINSYLAEEGYSTSALIGKLLNTTSTTAYRTLNKMEKEGLVKSHDMTGTGIGTGKQVVWGLTPTGAVMATDPEAEDFKVDYFEISRVSPITMRHSLDVQEIKIEGLVNGWTDWQSSRKMQQMANGNRSTWLQVPDALAISPKGYKVAIEVERNAKTLKRYEQILANYASMISNKTVDEVFYLFPNNQIAPRVKRIFSQIEKIKIDGRSYPVPESLLKRFKFLTYEQWRAQEI